MVFKLTDKWKEHYLEISEIAPAHGPLDVVICKECICIVINHPTLLAEHQDYHRKIDEEITNIVRE